MLDLSSNALYSRLDDWMLPATLTSLLYAHRNEPQRPVNTHRSRARLSRNRLFGPLPNSLTTLTNLTRLDLSYNNLEGDVALLDRLSYLSALLFNHNPRLSGRSPALRLRSSSWQW